MIRPLVADDLPTARRVIDAVGLFPSGMLDDMAAPYLGGPTDEVWLAADAGRGMGIAYCAPERMTQGTWNLHLIAVHPDAQRSGLGSALIAEVERRVIAQGGRVLLIETSGDDRYAGPRRFYGGLGYREEARVRAFYRAGEDKVVYWKSVLPDTRPARP